MKRLCFFIAAVLAVSCEQKPVQTDFTERIIDAVIDARNGTAIAMPDLHDKAFEVPDPKADKLILSEKLQARGFRLIETTNEVRGLTGVRSITQTLEKDGCQCEVTKTYGRTEYVTQYDVTEKIKCR